MLMSPKAFIRPLKYTVSKVSRRNKVNQGCILLGRHVPINLNVSVGINRVADNKVSVKVYAPCSNGTSHVEGTNEV